MELTEDSIKILIDLKFRKKTLSNLSQLHFCRCHVVRTSLHGLKSVGKTTGFFFGYKSLESKFITKEKKSLFLFQIFYAIKFWERLDTSGKYFWFWIHDILSNTMFLVPKYGSFMSVCEIAGVIVQSTQSNLLITRNAFYGIVNMCSL